MAAYNDCFAEAEFHKKTEYSEERIEITTYNPEVARLIRSHLRNDAQAALGEGQTELTEELVHLYNTITVALDQMEGKNNG